MVGVTYGNIMRVRDATVATLCAAALATGCGGDAWPHKATVEHVIDGDTVTVHLEDGGMRDVRVVGIDAPETPHGCYGMESARAARRMLAGQQVTLRRPAAPDDDPYGRMLAHVYVDGRLWAQRMAARGYARAAVWQPNDGHSEAISGASESAREDGRGMWGACG